MNLQTPCFRLLEEIFHYKIRKIEPLISQEYSLTFSLEQTLSDVVRKLVFIDFFESFPESFIEFGSIYPF